jgi:hypothetical protein
LSKVDFFRFVSKGKQFRAYVLFERHSCAEGRDMAIEKPLSNLKSGKVKRLVTSRLPKAKDYPKAKSRMAIF